MVALIASCVGADDAPTSPITGRCTMPVNIALNTVNNLTDWINALPKPTTIPCFIASLPRPLKVVATSSKNSAQPALGKHSPRVFLFINNLVLSVTVSRGFPGDFEETPFTDLLEFAVIPNSIEQAGPITTIKGEYKFPVESQLTYSAPYENIDLSDSASVCAVCHNGEALVATLDGVPIYESVMLQPFESSLVPIERLREERKECNDALQPYRCKALGALVDYGELVQWQFPETALFF